jgi:hypothetical protein
LRVHRAHRGVEQVQAHRLLRAPRRPDLPARGIGEVDAGGRHLVGDLGVRELREARERPLPDGAARPRRRTAAAADDVRVARPLCERPVPAARLRGDRAVERRVRRRGRRQREQGEDEGEAAHRAIVRVPCGR